MAELPKKPFTVSLGPTNQMSCGLHLRTYALTPRHGRADPEGQEEKEVGNLPSPCVLTFVHFIFMVLGLEPMPCHGGPAPPRPVYFNSVIYQII